MAQRPTLPNVRQNGWGDSVFVLDHLRGRRCMSHSDRASVNTMEKVLESNIGAEPADNNAPH